MKNILIAATITLALLTGGCATNPNYRERLNQERAEERANHDGVQNSLKDFSSLAAIQKCRNEADGPRAKLMCDPRFTGKTDQQIQAILSAPVTQ